MKVGICTFLPFKISAYIAIDVISPAVHDPAYAMSTCRAADFIKWHAIARMAGFCNERLNVVEIEFDKLIDRRLLIGVNERTPRPHFATRPRFSTRYWIIGSEGSMIAVSALHSTAIFESTACSSKEKEPNAGPVNSITLPVKTPVVFPR